MVITGLTRNQNKKAPQNKKTNSRLTCNDRSLMVPRSWDLISRETVLLLSAVRVTLKQTLMRVNIKGIFGVILTSKNIPREVNAISGLVRKR